MKFRTFRLAVVGGGLLAAAGLVGFCATRPASSQPPKQIKPAPQVLAPAPRPLAVAPAAPAAAPGEAAHVAYLVRTLGQAAGSDKQKDALGGAGAKVNLYAENGRWARAKVDLNRNEKWDEKWELDGTAVKREVAPADDEAYSVSSTWNGTAWSGAGAAPAAAAPAAVAAPAGGPREVDSAVLTALQGAVREKVKDALPGRPYKINLYSDDGKRFNRAKVDLNRNDKWDEKWEVDAAGTITREVAPADDEKYAQKFELRGGAWVAR
ncbi:MAG: hypothetical protein HY904_01545 [Deltaproteobacteria bacterium]|nr:hypothetical protein [Deltaproteobacteria bacterium]